MSFMFANPGLLTSAATDLTQIGSAINAATTAAWAPTAQLQAAAADEISTAVSALFSRHAVSYQAISAQATAFHDQFVQALSSGAGSYAAAETTNVQQMLLDAINAPTQTLLGRPLIGNGADGTATSPDGGAGGLLYATAETAFLRRLPLSSPAVAAGLPG